MIPKPWDRREGETDKAYMAFSAYLDMPDRSIKKVVDLLSIKRRQQVDKWAKKYDWEERVAAYDSSIVEALRQDKIKRRKKIAEKMDTVGNLMVDNAIEFFEKHNINRCSFRAATEMADVGSRLVIQALDFAEESAEDKTLTINIVNKVEGDSE